MPLINFKTPDSLKDGGPAWESKFGLDGICWTSADQSGSAAICTDVPDTGEKLVITDLMVAVEAAMSVVFSEEDGTDDLLRLHFPAAGTLQITPRGKFKLPTTGKRLMVRTSAAGNVYVTPFYYSEA